MNKRTAVTITDDNADNSVTIHAPILAHEIAEALTPWFDEALASTVKVFAECVARNDSLGDDWLGEVTALLGVTVETRTTEDELADVREAARDLTAAAAGVEQATAARDALLRRAVAAGASPTDVARAAGIARSRLYQILADDHATGER